MTKPLKFGEVEWKPWSALSDDCRCKTDAAAEKCEGGCRQDIEAMDFVDVGSEEEASEFEFGVSRADGSIVMCRKINKGDR